MNSLFAFEFLSVEKVESSPQIALMEELLDFLNRWLQRGSHQIQVGEGSNRWDVLCAKQHKNVTSIQFSSAEP